MKTTCQICEREILANTGVIAHHGYQRPDRGSGWQTASCRGARYLPYEQSCDQIQPCIDYIKAYVKDQKRFIKELMENPPETITERRYYGFHFSKPPQVYVRPEGFDAKKNLENSYGRGYEYEHRALVRLHQREVETSNRDIIRLTKRLADWKPQQ